MLLWYIAGGCIIAITKAFNSISQLCNQCSINDSPQQWYSCLIFNDSISSSSFFFKF